MGVENVPSKFVNKGSGWLPATMYSTTAKSI